MKFGSLISKYNIFNFQSVCISLQKNFFNSPSNSNKSFCLTLKTPLKKICKTQNFSFEKLFAQIELIVMSFEGKLCTSALPFHLSTSFWDNLKKFSTSLESGWNFFIAAFLNNKTFNVCHFSKYEENRTQEN